MAQTLSLMGILVDHRGEKAPQVQEIITRHGTEIIGRFGVPSPSKEKGLITLVMEAEPGDIKELADGLKRIEGVEVQIAEFKSESASAK